jgi:hypothetical protein
MRFFEITATVFRILERKLNKPIIFDGLKPISLEELIISSYDHNTLVIPLLPEINQKPVVTIISPALVSKNFFGGLATLLISGAYLSKILNLDLRILITQNYSQQLNELDILKFFSDNGILIEPERLSLVDFYHTEGIVRELPIHKEDVFLCSGWGDALMLLNLPLQGKFIYLIQDFEPIFFPNSDIYLRAESTYKSDNFIPLINTEMLHSYFKTKFDRYPNVADFGISFEPAVGQCDNIYASSNEDSFERKVFLYFRPAVQRNLAFSMLKAVQLAIRDPRIEHFKIQFYTAGGVEFGDIEFDDGDIIISKGKMTMEEYQEFMKGIDICVSPMMSPHPNYPTLEFASVGAVVITTKWETKQNLDFYSKNILMAEPTPEDIAEKIVEAVLFDSNQRIENFKQNNIQSDWADALAKPLDEVIRRLNEQ